MNRTQKLIILAEVVLAFGPIIYPWLLSLLFSPWVLIGMLHGDFGQTPLLLCATFGLLGFLALIGLLATLSKPLHPIFSPRFIKAGVCAGIIALFVAPIYLQAHEWIVWGLWLMPVLVSMHLVYMGRHFLFKSDS